MAYVVPCKRESQQFGVDDIESEEYERSNWDALRTSINSLVNKINTSNIKNIIPKLCNENLIQGRGLFCRICMKSQLINPGFSHVYAALIAVVNTKFPEIGNLLVRRVVLQLTESYKLNNEHQLTASVKFIAHLVNQRVVHEVFALELLTTFLEKSSENSFVVAVEFVKECGCILEVICPKPMHIIFEWFRGVLYKGEIDKRVEFMIVDLLAIRKGKFQGYPSVLPELDLVNPKDQITHEISLTDEIDPETCLDVFSGDQNFVEQERKYEELKNSLLGEYKDFEDGDEDSTNRKLVELRKEIYLMIMSSNDFEAVGDKLLKIKLEPGQEIELCKMLVQCCIQEKTYVKFYGLLGQRICMINTVYQGNFERCFVEQYSMIHRLETNQLRNVAKFFAHLLGTDALSWSVLAYNSLTEDDTTSSSRIFVKFLFLELAEQLGVHLLNERLNDESMSDSFESIFPLDHPRNTLFAINFFTSIGLGLLAEKLREIFIVCCRE